MDLHIYIYIIYIYTRKYLCIKRMVRSHSGSSCSTAVVANMSETSRESFSDLFRRLAQPWVCLSKAERFSVNTKPEQKRLTNYLWVETFGAKPFAISPLLCFVLKQFDLLYIYVYIYIYWSRPLDLPLRFCLSLSLSLSLCLSVSRSFNKNKSHLERNSHEQRHIKTTS